MEEEGQQGKINFQGVRENKKVGMFRGRKEIIKVKEGNSE